MIEILRENQDNQRFLSILKFLLDPFIITGLSKKKINKKVSCPPSMSLDDIYEAMAFVRVNNNGSDSVIATVQDFINKQEEPYRSFCKDILSKNLKLGCGAKTVNAAYETKFIPEFDCMLAEKYYEKTEYVKGKEFYLTLKLDGIRCLCVRQDNVITFYSRQGQIIEGLIELEKDVLSLIPNGVVLDGELLATPIGNEVSKDLYKRTTQIVRSKGNKVGIEYHIFDVINLSDFKDGNANNPYYERRKYLDQLKATGHTRILPVLYYGDDINMIDQLVSWARSNGQEGIMLNIADAPYEFKRTKNLLKVKVMQDVDLRIIGYKEGEGNLAGTLGALIVNYKNNKLNVGSGYTLDERDRLWYNRDTLLDKIVTIQYFEETENKDGVKSLRFPVFLRIREDKIEESYN